MKKVLLILLVLCMALPLAACNKTNETTTPEATATTQPSATTAPAGTAQTPTPEPTTAETEEVKQLSIFAMNGPTGMGLAGLVDTDNKREGGNIYTPTFASSADEYISDLIAGKFDIISVPTNLAAVLSQKAAGMYKVAAVNTLGVLYMLNTDGSVNDVKDLSGKTIYATGEGLVPGFVLEYVLKKNGFTVGEDVFVEYMTNPADIGALLTAGSASVAMLPQPYVATLTMKNEQIKVALDMTEEFGKASGENGVQLMTSCIAIKNSTYEENQKGIEQFIEEYKASVEYVNEHPKESSEIIVSLGIVAAAGVAEKAIPDCNIVYIDGDEMKSALNAFYSELYAFKPALCGGALPTDDIYLK